MALSFSKRLAPGPYADVHTVVVLRLQTCFHILWQVGKIDAFESQVDEEGKYAGRDFERFVAM